MLSFKVIGGFNLESLELRIFREVALEKSISKAAEKMGYVQSNITAHIHNLEAELETILFIRHSKGVKLTDEGQQLLVYADQIITLLDNAKNQFQKNEPSIKIGATQTMAAHRLPLWLSAYKRNCPNTSFSVSTHLQPELIEAVADGNLDCAFVYTEFNHPKLTSAFFYREQMALIAPKDLKPEEIVYQSIVSSNAPGCPFRYLLENWIMKRISRKPRVIQFDTVESIMKAVALGIGIAVLPISVLSDAATHNFQIFRPDDIGEANIQLLIPKSIDNPYLTQFVDTVKSYPI
jgi:LysR family transcriptional regulator, cell division regulator